ncbi:hypothetical protein D3C72_1329250 [compost metagenome]
MRLATQRLECFFQRIKGRTRIGQHLLTFVQQMQFIETQGADNDDIPVVIIAVWRRAFRQAGIGRLHQNDFVGVDAGAQHTPQLQQRAGEDYRQRFTLAGTEALAIAGGFFRVRQQV